MSGADFGWAVAASLVAVFIFELVRGSRSVWRFSLGYPNMRGVWVSKVTKHDDAAATPIYEKVIIGRQLGPWIRGATQSPASDEPAGLAGRAVALRMRGQFQDKQFIAYEHHQRWWLRTTRAELGAGVVKMARDGSAYGYAIAAGTLDEEPTVYDVELHPLDSPHLTGKHQ